MAIRIEWDEFEIALLIEACEEVLRKGKPKSEVVKTVSSNLRKRAISKNIAIDDVFRNENGIALQMQKMAYLLTHGEKGMPGASKLYAEVAELREENPKKFEEILKRAKEEIEMTDLSQQNIGKKALFAQWLNEHPIKKYTPSAIIDALDVASRYCVSKKVCKDGFWSMQNKAEFNAATSKLLSFRLFRLKYRSAAAKMDKAIPLYKAFLDSYVASREENTAEFEGEALNEPDSMLSTAAANSDDIIRLDFSDIGSLVFSKPVCLNYKDHTFTDFNSWASLYAKVAFLLKQDYPQIIVDGGSLSEGAAPEFSMNSKALRKPKAITDGLFIETNHSATEIASRIATLLRLCGVDLNKVSITYTLKKEAEQKRTSQARSENEKLYEKLYSISRIYDDPAGLSLNRITGLLGQSDDRELVQGILDHAPWAHRIENGIYSFASADTISARNEKIAGKDDTISDSAFYDYLDKTLCMAEPTCRSYVSAIRSAEKYAKDYGFTSYRIYDVTTSDAVALLNALMKDDGFAAYNIRQHNRFRAAFAKFAEMAGQSIAVKKTGAQLQNKPQEQPIAPFDKEKYIEILMYRYRNGITFDSIDFDNFRETYEDLYDSSIDADDDTLEKQLRLCGVFYNNRLFPAEGIMDDETREKLFTYIENSFSSGKKVLYYKAVFEDLADAFANCYSLADEHMTNVLPIHPYAALLLQHISIYYTSTARSMFNFIKNDEGEQVHAFQWFIDNYDFKSRNPFLTADMLWNFFYETGSQKLADGIKEVLSCYTPKLDKELLEDEKSVLKVILLLQAVSERMTGNRDIFLPNNRNLELAFEGTDLQFTAPKIAMKMLNDHVITRTPLTGDVFSYCCKNNGPNVDSTPFIAQAKQKSTKDMTFMAGSNLRSTIEFTGALRLRYSLAYATLSDFDSEIKKANNPSTAGNKLYVVATIGRDSYIA